MRNRRAFTLVELLVAMALTVFIMLILTQAFVISLETFSGLKAIGDAQENLRAAGNALRFDLSQDHLDGKRRVADVNLTTQRPSAGFFSVYNPALSGFATVNGSTVSNFMCGTNRVLPGMAVTCDPSTPVIGPNTYVVGVLSPTSFTISTNAALSGQFQVNVFPSALYEGMDLDGMTSWRSNLILPAGTSGLGSVLHMTCRLKGNQQQSFYTTQIGAAPAALYNPVNPNNPSIQFFNLRTQYGIDPLTLPGVDADATWRPNYTTLPPNPPPNFPVGPYFYRSQWAEVVYFLASPVLGAYQPTGTTEEPLNPNLNDGGLPVFGLYRAQYGIAPDTSQLNAAAFPGLINAALNQTYAGMACNPAPAGGAPMVFRSPEDLAGSSPSPLVTLISASSNGQTLPQATINVASTARFPSSGQLAIMGPGLVNSVAYITYTGTTPTSFTGCSTPTLQAQTSSAGVMATNNQVVLVSAAGALTNFWTLTPVVASTGGTFTITVNGVTTQAIPFNAPAALVQAALQSLPNVGTSNVAVGGGAASSGQLLISFAGPSTASPTTLTVDSTNLVGGTLRLAPWRTFDPAAPAATPLVPPFVLRNATLITPNVLSFQVRGVFNNATAPVDVVYDTATSSMPMLGVSITIRVWDNKTRQARQMTIYQDL